MILFNKAVQAADATQHQFLKNWMVTACLVAAAYTTVQISYFLYFLPLGIRSMQALELSPALLSFCLLTKSISLGVPLAKSLYQKGLELSKAEKWTAMENHLRHRKNQVSLISDRIVFSIGLFHPEIAVEFCLRKMKVVLLHFTSDDFKEASLNEFLRDYDSIAGVVPLNEFLRDYGSIAGVVSEDATTLYPQIVAIVKTLPCEKQLPLIPKLQKMNPNALQDLDEEVERNYNEKVRAITETHQTIYATLNREAQELYNIIDNAQNDNNGALSKELKDLVDRISSHISDVKSYTPAMNCEDLTTLLNQLKTGTQAKKLQTFRSQANAGAGDFDPTDLSWNYFVMHDTSGHANEGQTFIQSWFPLFGVSEVDTLDKELTKMEIGTIGEFVNHVLGNDRELLKNHDEVLKRLRNFIARKNDLRGRIYSYFAGAQIKGNQAMNGAGKAAYKFAMILTAVAPMIVYPKLTMLGMAMRLAYETDNWIKENVDDVSQSTNLLNQYQSLWSLATRRPFISLLSSSSSGELTTFQNSDCWGQMRILSFEFLIGWFMLVATFDRRGHLKGLGGVITGIALAREIRKLARS